MLYNKEVTLSCNESNIKLGNMFLFTSRKYDTSGYYCTFLWNAPTRAKNSPAQFKLNGTAALKIVNKKNKIVKTGIIKAIPL